MSAPSRDVPAEPGTCRVSGLAMTGSRSVFGNASRAATLAAIASPGSPRAATLPAITAQLSLREAGMSLCYYREVAVRSDARSSIDAEVAVHSESEVVMLLEGRCAKRRSFFDRCHRRCAKRRVRCDRCQSRCAKCECRCAKRESRCAQRERRCAQRESRCGRWPPGFGSRPGTGRDCGLEARSPVGVRLARRKVVRGPRMHRSA